MSAVLNSLREGEAPEVIDQALADAVCEWIGCREDWFRHTLMAVSEALQEGHTCLHLPYWAGQTRWQSDISSGIQLLELADWRERLQALAIRPDDNAPVVFEQDRFYLRRYWRFETEVASSIRKRLAVTENVDASSARATLERLFPSGEGRSGPDWQKVAAANALLQRFSVIAGGPGTGKTHTVTRLLALLIETTASDSSGTLRVHLAAPTGKAAQRLAQSVVKARSGLAPDVDDQVHQAIPQEATTLHRLLGVIPNSHRFRHNEDNPLNVDILVVDEISMVDLPLMARLFRALPPKCRVILLGDADQLPSVAAGSVLADLAPRDVAVYSSERCRQLATLGIDLDPADGGSGGADYLSLLRESRRFEGSSGIGQLAAAAISGDGEGTLNVLRGAYDDVVWHAGDALSEQLAFWTEQQFRPVTEAGNLEEAFERLRAFRVLCPARIGPNGVHAINERVTAALNRERQRFFRGQPIMITRNHYGLGLYNGDIGLIWPDEPERKGETPPLLAWFPGEEGFTPMAPGRLPDHETVYAMTIHKTQGSEFDAVALVLPERPSAIVSRELIYTGVTRARSRLTVIGSEPVWRAGISRVVERHSGLGVRLRAGKAEHS
ncbi:exodeoxyribonuclease V subunit alpha [Salicola sp. Rm-C-2C1-2]|uniref:exodeoxyribonuclease V subunit alpha n=1 Tax=Salicola sp. Rm-C-2C1-2 TaxID=3141321 RepID=UPI0032E4DBEE